MAYQFKSGDDLLKKQLHNFHWDLSKNLQQKLNGQAYSKGFKTFSFLIEKNLQLAMDLVVEIDSQFRERALLAALPAFSSSSQTLDQCLESINSESHQKLGLLGPKEENILKNDSGASTRARLNIIAESAAHGTQ